MSDPPTTPLPLESFLELDPHPRTMPVLVERVRTDGDTQPRAMTDWSRAGTYAEDLARGDTFPPIVVFDDGEHLWLSDGFHRLRAVKAYHLDRSDSLEGVTIDAIVYRGTVRQARLLACRANHGPGHGIPRNSEDRRLAIDRVLQDPELSRWSDTRIASWCHVSQHSVSNRRAALEPASQRPVRMVVRNGSSYLQDTSGIRASNKAKAARRQLEEEAAHAPNDDPLGGAASKPRSTTSGHRETQPNNQALQLEVTVLALIRTIETLPGAAAAAVLLRRGVDLARLERAAMWFSDLSEELRDRADAHGSRTP